MNHILSHARAVWHNNTYIGTAEPCASIKAKCTHNMDVDYWFTRKCDDWIHSMGEDSLEPVNIKEWFERAVVAGELVEVESLEHSRDMRDVWFFGQPAWVTQQMRQELVVGNGTPVPHE